MPPGLWSATVPPASNFRSTQSLPDYLAAQGIAAISRHRQKPTRILRKKAPRAPASFVGTDAERAPLKWRRFGMAGQTWPGSCRRKPAPNDPKAPGSWAKASKPD